MFEVKGIIAAMATPFWEDESINEQELRNHVERMIAGGVHGLFLSLIHISASSCLTGSNPIPPFTIFTKAG